MLDDYICYSALGDFEERFHNTAIKKGKSLAFLFYWSQVILLVPTFFKNSLYWSFEMFKNYFKLGSRNIIKHKGFSFINITGLALGFALFILVALYVQFELSFDRFHENQDRIYRVEQVLAHESSMEPTAGCPTALAAALSTDMAGFEGISKVLRHGLDITTSDNRTFGERDVFAVDNTFLDIFTFPLLKGDSSTALIEPYSLVITESLAKRFFGIKEPIGQVIRANNQFDLTITGVIEDVPNNSHLRFNALLSVSTYPALYGTDVFNRWADNWVPLYVLLEPKQSFQETNEKLLTFLKKYQGETSRNELYLRPLNRIHLYSDVNSEFAVVGSINNIYIFIAISIFVLIIACINFMNLSTARSADRAREVGMRKVVGAHRSSLIRQFLCESFLTVLFAMVLGILLAKFLLPEFNQIVSRQLSLSLLNNWTFTLGL
ncbi:MAG: ABC transporter permease, partial [Candidatus Aminicenantes bacterium]|nr:ABC transporter permease [Candidatus Aminicenantes bacterium]